MKQQEWTPETLVKKLKENVMGQDKYLKDLCTAVWMHSLSKDSAERLGYSVDGVKLNMLVLGKSGTGKTFAIQSLAKLLNLNLVIEDASVFTGAGWKGREVSSIVKDIIKSATEKNLNPEYSIVVLDEIDKVLENSSRVGSFSAWNNFLKLIEGSYIEYSENQNTYHMNTNNVLFICLGAFDGLEAIIKNRMKAGTGIGFGTKSVEMPESDIFQYAKKEDLIAYGISPQFLGRMAMITATNELKEEDYVSILTKSKSSAISRLNNVLLSSMGVEASITKNAAYHMAHKAVREQTGGRALLAEVTEAFKEGMYKVAGRDDVKELRLKYTARDGLKMQFVKGERKSLPKSKNNKWDIEPQYDWLGIPLNITKYGITLASAYQYVEDMVEIIEMPRGKLSRQFAYREIRAAMYLIMSAFVYLVNKKISCNMYDLATQIDDIVANPPVFDIEMEKIDDYIELYWTSLGYEDDVNASRNIAFYIIQEYCLEKMWNEEKIGSAV